MARYTAEQIYAFAREAGFSPDQAATMTAVALAESGGNSGAHNPYGEDSRGLWQINVRAHSNFGQINLYDPLQNAKAAYVVSHGGADISPWTTTHGGQSARYLRYRAQAEAAAAAYGDGPGHGMWRGTAGYGDHVGAGSAGGASPSGGVHSSPAGGGSDAVVAGHSAALTGTGAEMRPGEEYGIPLDPPAPVDGMEAVSTSSGSTVRAGAEYGIPLDSADGQAPVISTLSESMSSGSTVAADQPVIPGDGVKLQKFLHVAQAQTGDHYVWGAHAGMNDPDPTAFDCSDLVQWATHQVGVNFPRTAWEQYEYLHKGGHTIPIDQAIHTPGALLFSFSSDPDKGHPAHNHVAISLGNGRTMEAKGTQYGVGSWEATTKRFQYAAVIPGVSDGQLGGQHASNTTAHTTYGMDDFEYRMRTDPAAMDADPTTVAASQELTAALAVPIEHHDQNMDISQATVDNEHGDLGDVDHDGMDDALQHAMEFSAQFDGGHDHIDHTADHIDHHDAPGPV